MLHNPEVLLIKKLKEKLSERGAVAEFCRASKLPRKTVDHWLHGTRAPTVKMLGSIAHGLGLQPWELIKPEDAQPTPAPAEALAAAALSSPVLRHILSIWPKLDNIGRDALLVAAEDLVREQTRRKKPPQNGSSSQGTR